MDHKHSIPRFISRSSQQRHCSPSSIEEIMFDPSEVVIKILNLIDSDNQENKILGIQLAKSQLGYDCYDLCHLKKKRAIVARHNRAIEYCFLFEILELSINGWAVSSINRDISDNIGKSYATWVIVLVKYGLFHSEPKMTLEISDDLGKLAVNILSESIYKYQPYENFLLTF